jgi:hypothetical protein
VTAPEAGPTEVLGRLADRFDEDSLPYAIGGALALGAWGVPRTTSDVDVSVFVSESELDRLLDSLERAGAMVEREEAHRTVARTGLFVAFFARTRIDLFIAHHPWHAEMQRRRVSLPTPDGQPRWFLSLEDTALAKLLYARPKDVQDLDRLFAVQAGRIDLVYLRQWLPRMVPAGDTRLQLLDELVRKLAFEPGSTAPG